MERRIAPKPPTDRQLRIATAHADLSLNQGNRYGKTSGTGDDLGVLYLTGGVYSGAPQNLQRTPGLFSGRGADQTYLTGSYAELNDGVRDLSEQFFHGSAIVPNQSNEGMVEVGHVFQVTPFWSLAPTAQYIINPGLTDDVDNAVVVGVKTVVAF